MMYGLKIDLLVTLAPGVDLHEHVEAVAEAMATTEATNDALLDFGIGSDSSRNTVEIEVTITGDTIEAAMAAGISWVRSSIHAAGGATPDWEVDAADAAEVVEYRVKEAVTTPIAA